MNSLYWHVSDLDRSVANSKQLGANSAFNRAMFLEEAMWEIAVCKSLWEMSGKMDHVATC